MTRAADDHKDPKELIIIGLDTEDGPEHPLWDDRIKKALNPEMTKNIIFMGVKQPVSVRLEAGKYYVVDGRQRVRNARVAADQLEARGEPRVSVPIWIDRGSDEHLASSIVVYNEFRAPDEPLARAFKAARLFGLVRDIDQVAINFGKTANTIKAWIELVEADPSLHAAVKESKISFSLAVEIANKPRDMHKKLLEKELSRQAQGLPNKQKSLTKKPHAQKGVLRSWLRQANKTKAASALSEERKQVLEWIATGETSKGSWIEDFIWEATQELEQAAQEKAEKKGKRKENPDAGAEG